VAHFELLGSSRIGDASQEGQKLSQVAVLSFHNQSRPLTPPPPPTCTQLDQDGTAEDLFA
jgi:hypothetical protein